VQPVAICCQSTYVHKPAIVKLSCYLFTVSNSGLFSVQLPRPASQSRLLSMQRPCPVSHAHFRYSHIPELICGVNSSTDNNKKYVLSIAESIMTDIVI